MRLYASEARASFFFSLAIFSKPEDPQFWWKVKVYEKAVRSVKSTQIYGHRKIILITNIVLK